MSEMYPEDFGITETPTQVKNMFGDDAVSPGDGSPVVTVYPQYPASAMEMQNFIKKNEVPDFFDDLQKQFPDLFEAELDKMIVPGPFGLPGNQTLAEVIKEKNITDHWVKVLDELFFGPRKHIEKFDKRLSVLIDRVKDDASRTNVENLLEYMVLKTPQIWPVQDSLDEVYGEFNPELFIGDNVDYGDDGDEKLQKMRTEMDQSAEDFLEALKNTGES